LLARAFGAHRGVGDRGHEVAGDGVDQLEVEARLEAKCW